MRAGPTMYHLDCTCYGGQRLAASPVSAQAFTNRLHVYLAQRNLTGIDDDLVLAVRGCHLQIEVVPVVRDRVIGKKAKQA